MSRTRRRSPRWEASQRGSRRDFLLLGGASVVGWLGDEPWLELRGGAANGHAAGPAPAPAEEEEEEDEEALDQRVCASRNHIKQLLRARGCP